MLVSALNEDPDRMSVHYAGQVIRKSLLLSPGAGRMGVPTIPLSDLYSRAIDYMRSRGGQVELSSAPESFQWSEETRQWTVATQDQSFTSDAVVLALAFEGLSKLLPALPQNPEAEQLAMNLECFEHSPITGIHLWFDREITDLEHAILLDTTIQWMFHKSRLQPEKRRGEPGSYVELVVSASKSLVGMQRQEIIDLALRELAEFFPLVAAGEAAQSCGGEGGARDVLHSSATGFASTVGVEPVAARFSGGRLDRHRMAGHDGGRRPQRLPGGRSGEPRRWEASPLSASRLGCDRTDALVALNCGILHVMVCYDATGRATGNRWATTFCPATPGQPEPGRSRGRT